VVIKALVFNGSSVRAVVAVSSGEESVAAQELNVFPWLRTSPPY
jgi:hypothetical protein